MRRKLEQINLTALCRSYNFCINSLKNKTELAGKSKIDPNLQSSIASAWVGDQMAGTRFFVHVWILPVDKLPL